MSRARATTLALVNWKGVFFERYLLDPRVTALEGANGAGKTTVMIAAYVVLMPDLSRLRFTNLGETAATGGDRGIYGRLGVLGRPSYAAIELELGGERVILCVHLERKAEPSVQITAFMVHGLPLVHGLSSLFLLSDGQTESVPALPELKARASELGARVEAFESVRDYFSALFERGIVPLRLANDDDRAKFNEMLRTSMTGGISRALTSELTTFLLKEESGLSDTLSRMRANLDACRRTRTEVQEARVLEREISGVYSAGAAMFTAALGAVQAEVVEATRELDAEQARQNAARFALGEAEAALADGVAREAVARERVSAARGRLDSEKARREGLLLAAELAVRSEELKVELLPADAAKALAAGELERAQETREAAKHQLGVARAAYDQAARGLANLQTGLEELHRRAHAFRRGHAALSDARTLLSEPELAEEGLTAALERSRTELQRVDRERARRERELGSAKQRQAEFAAADGALRSLAGTDIDPREDLHARARSELGRFAELTHRARELPTLAPKLERSRRDEQRREEVRARVAAAGIDAAAGEVTRAVERQVQSLSQDFAREEEAARAFATSRREAEENASRLAQRLSEGQAVGERFQRCRGLIERLAPEWGGTPPSSREDVRVGRERLLGERETMRAKAFALRARREAAIAEASRLERDGGGFEPALLELCEELGGELLAARFEDIEVERAARLQAELGPLARAIVVDDVRAAITRLETTATPLEEVLLVRAGETLRDEDAELLGSRFLVVRTNAGVRASRLPVRPSLGRGARDARRQALLDEADHAALELERQSSDLRRMDALIAGADELLREAELGFGPDPREALAGVGTELEAARALAIEHGDASLACLTRAAELRKNLESQRSLLAEAHLLDQDEPVSVPELERALREAEAAHAQVTAGETAARALAEAVEALREPPPSVAELARFEAERAALDTERDRWFQAGEALESAIETRQARSYTGADSALDEGTRLVPALESELEALGVLATQADSEVGQAEARLEELGAVFRDADSRRGAIAAHLERALAELSRRSPHFAPELILESEQELSRAAAHAAASEQEAAAVAEELGSLRERRRQAELGVGERSRALALQRAAVEPLEARRRALHDKIAGWGLGERASTLDSPAAPAATTGRELLSEARSRREVLLDRLRRARGGQTLAEELEQREASETEAVSAYVASWREVRDWLARRLPSQVAEVADPLDALDRLRDHLALLEERLNRQELDLRGASEDVARGIDVKLRRAASQVRRLNQHLEGISFGSIARIRLDMHRIERMDQILSALREGQAQELLFQNSLPVEEALDEIFRRYGGGKGGGQRLLDYREYLTLEVAVERKAKPGFEAVSPTRLSTGEAIGVGAALMMVVLTEWERDANLFRNRRAEGTLRFLFLDEANRLSQDNLGVLFDLCENLDLQLLIAAPEVARSTGNTTYRLVRQVGPDGTEEVIVTGRRAVKLPEAQAVLP